MRRALMLAVLGGLLIGSAAPGVGQAAGVDNSLSMTAPSRVVRNLSDAIEFRLPRNVAAVEGRLVYDSSAVEVVGLAPQGQGTSFRPVDIAVGVAFGAYGLKPSGSHTVMRIVVAPLVSKRVQFRLVIDAAASAGGQRISIGNTRTLGTLQVDGASELLRAPAIPSRQAAPRGSGPTRSLFGDGQIGVKDLDIVRASWELARANDATCAAPLEGDANGDGCVDIVDVQAVLADQGRRAINAPVPVVTPVAPSASRPFAMRAGMALEPTVVAAASSGPNFVVDTTADTADASPGNGICADAANNCSLRAAITESNWWPGNNRIEFNLVGIAPVRIQLLAGMPTLLIQDRSGGVTIDGYTQPGSRVNTAQFGSNAIMGVEIRGNGNSPQGHALRLTSPNNTIRGLLLNNLYRPLVLDGPDAQNNLVIGNWVGYNSNGTPHTYNGNYNIALNTGASNNRIGTPALADRNVSGRGTHAIDLYGPGTNSNIIQNNLLCTTPNGTSTAACSTAIDHNHGPKFGLIGGIGANERNIIGRTTLQGIEYSHGWDPNGIDNATWQVNNNRSIGNWVGFRADGSYDSTFRSGQNNPGTNDNGNGINVYDGSNFNLIEGNYVASVYDGIQTMSPNATGNTIRNNIIGMSPTGQAAPLTRYGISVRLHTKGHVIEGNLISNTAGTGIAVIDPDVRFVRLSRNLVTDTNAAAIYLMPYPSGPGGANDLQAAPVISSATTIFVNGTGTPSATVEVFRASRSAGQSGLPIAYLGSTVVDGSGSWSLPVSIAIGTVVTALQIRTTDDTSALSTNVAAVFEAPPAGPVAEYESGQQADSLRVNFQDTSTGAPTTWSWAFGDGGTSNQRNPSHTYTVPGEYTVVLTAGNAGGSNQRSRQVTVNAISPPVGGFVVADAFSRWPAGGWGSAERGGAYTLQGTAANYSVANGVGRIVMPSAGASRSALLNAANERDVDISFRINADKSAAGGSCFVYVVARRNGTSEYRPRLVFNGNGTMSVGASVINNNVESSLGAAVVVPGLVQNPGSFVRFRADVSGASPTTIRVKAWADGQAEPTSWQFTANDSSAAVQSAGSLGLRLYLAGGVSNSPITLSFDDYVVGGPPPPPPPPPPATFAADLFGRSAIGAWGTADSGGAYTLQGGNAAFSVANGTGQVTLPSAGANRSALLDSIAERDVDIMFRVSTDKVATGGPFYVYAVARRNGSNAYRPKLILNPDGTVSVHAGAVVNNEESSLSPAVVVPGLTHGANAFIWIRAQVYGTGSTTVRVKAWADGQSEPANWQYVATDSTAGLQGPGGIGLRAYLAGGVNNSPVLFSFDELLVRAVP